MSQNSSIKKYSIDELLDNLERRLDVVKTTQNYDKLDFIISAIYREHVYNNQNFTIDDFEKINQLLLNYKIQIMEWVKERFEHSVDDGVQVLRYLEDAGVDWPELEDWIHKNKTVLVKQLLKSMKYSEYETVLNEINALWQLEIDWRELDIIATTAEKEAERKRHRDDDEDDYIDDHDLNEEVNVTAKVNNIVHELLRDGYLDVSIRQLEDQGLRDPEIVAVLEPHAKQIVDNIISEGLPHYTIYELMLLLQIGAKWDNIITAIATNKVAVIKYLLTELKDNSRDDYMLESLYNDIERLKSFGIHWKELDIVQNGVVSELKRRGVYDDDDFDTIDENADNSGSVNSIIQKMLKSGYINIALDRLEDSGLGNSDIVKLLRPHAKQLLDIMTNKVRIDRPISKPFGITQLLLLIQVGAKWPDLLAVIANDKDYVVKHLLEEFKYYADDGYELNDLRTTLDQLKNAGINWPEIDIIKKSINVELARMKSDYNDDLTEAQPVIPPKIVKSFNTHLNRIYEHGISRLAYMIIEMKNLGATDQHIASLLSEKRQEIVRILRNTIHNESPKNWRVINEFATAIASLIDLGIKWPPLLELLNYYQDKIEAWAVAAITDAGFGKHVAEVLRKFKQLGYDITPIRRAIKTGILPTLKEYIATHGLDHYTYAKLQSLHKLNLLPKSLDNATVKLIVDSIGKTISEKGIPNDFGNSLTYLAAMNIPNLESTVKEIIEANKTPVIKTLLTAMKTGLTNANNYYLLPTYYIVDTIQLLHKLGITWPEMTAITRSLKAVK